MKRAFIRGFIILLILLGLFPTVSRAQDSGGFLFSVAITLPANQLEQRGYYHIPGKPGETVALEAKVTSRSKQALTVKAVALNAYSSANGILYVSQQENATQKNILVDDRYGLAQYFKPIDPITLQPGETQTVAFSITLPDLTSGTLLGAIRFITFAGTQELQEASEQNRNTQMLIDKYQAIDTAVQIDLPNAATPSVTMGTPSFDSEQAAVRVEITNEAPLLQKNITGTYEIRDSQGGKLFTGELPAFKMSPESRFFYPLYWQGKTLEAGSYALSLSLNVDGQPLSLEKPFEVNKVAIEQARQALAKHNPDIQPDFPLWLQVTIEVFILGMIIAYLRQRRHRRFVRAQE